MRIDQPRYFCYSDLLPSIQRLSRKAHQKALGIVLNGDIMILAGGHFNSVHTSHQLELVC